METWRRANQNSLDPLVVYRLLDKRAKALNVQLLREIPQGDACAAVL